MRKHHSISVIVVVVALTLVSPITTPCFAKRTDQIVVSQRMDVQTMDWALTSSMESLVVARNIFDRLCYLDDKWQYSPMLAESWKVVDNRTWQFKLRKGVKFHNGEVFDAGCVKFTIDRMKAPETKSVWSSLVKNIEEVRVLDDYTVEIKTAIPLASLLDCLNYINIIPAKTVKSFVNPGFGTAPVGTGPYKFVDWVKDERIVLQANENYWRGAPKIKRVVFRPIPEDSSRISALMTGEVDVISAVPPSRWAEINNGKETQMSAKVGSMLYMGLNTFTPPFDNLKVRKALNHAIDVQSIINSILKGTAERMNGPFFEGTIGYDRTIKPYEFDIEKAKTLLKEAGYANGFDTTLTSDPVGKEGITNMGEVAEAVAFQLKKVGINVKVELQERAVMWPRYQAKELKMYFSTWPETVEPDYHLRPLFHSKTRGYYYKNPVVDELLDEGINTFDWAERTRVYRKLHRVLFDDAPYVYLYSQKIGFGTRKAVNFKPPVDGLVYIYDQSLKP